MNERSPVMYHGNGGFGKPRQIYTGPGQLERQSRQYPMGVLQIVGGAGSGQGTQRRWQPRRDRQQAAKGGGDSAFGDDSDDSSLSSNASGSNKSGEKGVEPQCRAGHAHGGREWRARGPRREARPQRCLPHDRYFHATHPYQVKYTPEDLLNGSKYDSMSQDMWDKFVKSQQTEDTFRKKMNLWRFLYVAIKTVFPRYGLYVVGSTMTGFALESSDMDLCLFVRAAAAAEPRAHALAHLGLVLHCIRNFDPDAELIQAKVPIVKFREASSGLQVDLNCNNVVGIRNTNLLHYFSTLDWRVRPLVAVAKLWARAHHINDARQRTLSSYALTLMVIHFLQCGTEPAVLPRAACAGREWRARSRCSLAELFIGLLHYYAHFPYARLAVSVRAGGRVPVAECRAARASKNDPHQWKLLCVEEPFDLTNTARSVYDPETFEKIVDTFRTSHARVAATRRLQDAWPPR